METGIEISVETVAAIVRRSFNLTVAPIHETLYNLGIREDQLHALKRNIRDHFKLAIRVSLHDTVFTLTSRML